MLEHMTNEELIKLAKEGDGLFMAYIDPKRIGLQLNEKEIFDQIGTLIKARIGGTGRLSDYEIFGDSSVYNKNNLLAEKLSDDPNIVRIIKFVNELNRLFSTTK